MTSRHSRSRKRKLRREHDALTLPLNEALQVIRDARQAPIRHVAAANTLLQASVDSNKVSLEDLLECVRRGHVAAQLGARALNLRTGRRTEDNLESEDSIVDIDFWVQYIQDMTE